MLTQEQISEVLDIQNETFLGKNQGLEREKSAEIDVFENFATIITGVRRSGKSTLLLQILKKEFKNALFLNFEDPRLAGFVTNDFRRLDLEIKKRGQKVLFFDEIQMLENWELYVRQKLDEGFQILVTGSNATLLSRELGTKLTGRHLSYELFPFSYAEFLSFKNLEKNENSTKDYLQKGGFPEYLKTENANILNQLLDDILMRDIAVRFAIRDVNTLRQLAVYLISNIGKPTSATNLKNLFDLKSTSAILEYFSHLEDAYVVQFISKFSYSLKVQIRNPKKVYAIDLGLFTQNSIIFTDENGRRLENAVYLHLRRNYKEIYYFNEKKECDFVVIEKGKAKELIQVCYDLNGDNLNREIDGLMEAMQFFETDEAKIITFNQTDEFIKDGKTIKVLPFHDFAV